MKGEQIDIVKLYEEGGNFEDINGLYNMIRSTRKGMSWGINSPFKFKERVLAFKVQGLLLKGQVYLSVENDDFTITFTNTIGKIVEQLKWIGIENLVDTIDRTVEQKGSLESYKKALTKEYNRAVFTL